MFRHFEAWALPWYEQFQTLADVADAFFHLRIAGPPGGWPKAAGPRPPDPFGWSMYGWMLEECGKREEATSWLQKAYDELSKPLWVKSGVPVAPGTKGAREMRRPVEEERLAELLRQSLGIPLEAAYPR